MTVDLVTPETILDEVRKTIRLHAGEDPDKWFYANRFVYARLQLDERKTKTAVKKTLFEAKVSCSYCGKPFASSKGVNLHRVDEDRGYSDDNCTLMHPECHRQHHTENPRKTASKKSTSMKRKVRMVSTDTGKKSLEKSSKRHTNKPFLYWWDFSHGFPEKAHRYKDVHLLKEGTGEFCVVPIGFLLEHFTEERRTSRKARGWGVKVLLDYPNAIALEPGNSSGEWLVLKVKWEKLAR